MVKTQSFQCRACGFHPWSGGTRISHPSQCSQKLKTKKKNLSGIIGHYVHPDMMDYEVHSTTYEIFSPKRPSQGIRSNFQHTEHLEAKETS